MSSTNTFKTFLFLGGLTLLFVWLGGLMGGQGGMMTAFLIACLMNAGAYWFSDKIVLSMYRAKPIAEESSPELFRMIRDLSARAGIPMPKVYVMPEEVPNAFATGRDPEHAAVAVTEGIVRLLSKEELAGVIAHELAHIKNRDILLATIAATLAGAVSMLADMARWGMIFGGSRSDERDGGSNPLVMIVAMFLVPIAALLIQLAVSRSREFAADETGARIKGDPLPLAEALLKLETWKGRSSLETHPATAHLFIVNPLKAGAFMKLFSTHPPIQERVEKLRAMAR